MHAQVSGVNCLGALELILGPWQMNRSYVCLCRGR